MEKYSLEKASEEAEKIAQKVKSGEAASYADAEKKLNSQESELSPEIIEKIMQKVQDINAAGTPFHVWHGESIDQIQYPLKEGILGLHKKAEPESRKVQWKQTMKEEPKLVFFNIMGRQEAFPGDGSILQKMEDTAWLVEREEKISVAFIFDLTGYEEIAPTKEITHTMNSRSFPRKSFSAHNFFMCDWQELFGEHAPGSTEVAVNYKKAGRHVDATGRPIPRLDYGFALPNRIAPRAFRGAVLQLRKTDQGKIAGVDRDSETNQKTALQIAQMMKHIDQNNVERILPIYDIDGNLLWPKQMSHEEVMAFTADSGTQKTEKESDVI